MLMCVLALLAPVTYAAESARSTYGSVSALDFAAGVIPPTNGVYVRQDVWFYEGELHDSVFNGAITADADLKAMGTTTRLFWYPGLELLGARYGAYLSLSLVDGEARSAITARLPGMPPGTRRSDADRSGVSDAYFTPLSLGWNLGDWQIKWTEAVVLPISDYDASAGLNIGRNYYALNSSLGVTHRKGTTGPELNFRTGFIWNDENPDTDYRTGNEVYADGSFTWRFTPALTAGLTGYAYRQVTPDSGSGAVFGDFEGESYAAGPIVRCFVDTSARRYSLIAKWLHQFESTHLFEGDMVMISLATRF